MSTEVQMHSEHELPKAAQTRLHHNVLAIALANKLARIAWAVLNKGRAFECVKTHATAPRLV
jgi:transposase